MLYKKRCNIFKQYERIQSDERIVHSRLNYVNICSINLFRKCDYLTYNIHQIQSINKYKTVLYNSTVIYAQNKYHYYTLVLK